MTAPLLTLADARTPPPGAGQHHHPDRLVSGEAVELDIRVARIGSRVLALLVDIVIQICLLLVLAIASTFAIGVLDNALVDAALVQGVTIVCIALVVVGYPLAFETLTRGRTLGKLLVGLRVVRDDGGPIQFRHALTRNLVSVAVEWPGLVLPPITWVVGLATMMANPHSKRLGDLAAGTIVIHERAPASWGWVPAMPPPLARWAALLDLTGLDDDLALAVRHFLARNRQIAEPARSRLGYALALEVATCTTPPPPRGVPGWAYLAAVLAERHRRAAHRLALARTASAAVWPALGAPPSRLAVRPASSPRRSGMPPGAPARGRSVPAPR